MLTFFFFNKVTSSILPFPQPVSASWHNTCPYILLLLIKNNRPFASTSGLEQKIEIFKRILLNFSDSVKRSS